MAPSKSASGSVWRMPKRVAYVVNHSFPYSSDGYAVRTHEMARALNKLGHEMIVINRPGRPWDIQGFSFGAKAVTERMIDGVRYVFLPASVQVNDDRRDRLRLAERVLLEAFEVFRPGAVVAVSNWENAEPAQYAARRFGVPFFYEQRGFWEMSRAVREPGYEFTADYARDSQNELRVAQAAQAVFTLSEAMRSELVRRGVAADRVHLIPNGISHPAPVVAGVDRAGLGCHAKYLLGYIGSLNDYEGPEDLVEVLSLLRRDGVDVDLLLVGSGAPMGLIGSGYVSLTEAHLNREIRRLGLESHVHFVPQVGHEMTGTYYSLLDAVIMPRRRSAVTELVAPLKPYAAASYGVPVFMSDLPPLREVAKDIRGSLFPVGDTAALATMLRLALEKGDHPAARPPVDSALYWTKRVQPMSQQLQTAMASQVSLTDLFAGLAKAVGDVQAQPMAITTSPAAEALPRTPAAKLRFDTHILPGVALRGRQDPAETVAVIGPCVSLPRTTRIIRLTRVNILSELATADFGRFVIDWAGLQRETGDGEWDGLWSIDNMRLNRQVMDACRIAQDRGLTMQVIGPVERSKAPLFRTVAGVLDETLPREQDDLRGAVQ